MKIFKENNRVRLQLMDLNNGVWLFDFSVEEERYEELREHMIDHLNEFEV